MKNDEGVHALLQSAHTTDREVRYLLKGDLRQMSIQGEFLRNRGIDARATGGNVGVCSEEDYKKSLRLIWSNKVEGWWNYKDDLLKYGICQAERFDSALNIECERNK
jgi:hypothetical protein